MLLTPSQTRRRYQHAARNGYAILAVNADSPAAVTDCLFAARKCDAPIIVETSLWQLTGQSYGAGDPILGIDRYLADIRVLAHSERFREVPVIFHTDHIKGPKTVSILRHAIRRGASSLSLDSSKLSHDENIATLVRLCDFARENHLLIALEMEASVDDGLTTLDETRALFGEVEKRCPGQLALWAPGVGTRHGLGNDLAGFDPEAVRQQGELASEIAGRPIGIALHGSSGLSTEQLRAAVSAGVVKVNWSSESLLIRSQAAREYYAKWGDRLEEGHPGFKETAIDASVQGYVSKCYVPKVVERIRLLGGVGRTGEFRNSPEAKIDAPI